MSPPHSSSNPTSTQQRPAKRKACTECRQQKLRCDLHLNYAQPCSRCRRLKRECRVEEKFQRTNKRQKLKDMERELQELQGKLDSSGGGIMPSPVSETTPTPFVLPPPPPPPPLPAPVPLLPVRTPSPQMVSGPQPWSDRIPAGNCYASVPPPIGSVAPTTTMMQPPSTLQPLLDGLSSDQTLPRALDGTHVPAAHIDQIFNLYFTHYHPLLPVISPIMPPNYYYTKCPFLFWILLSIGCRKYAGDPTLLSQLQSSVLALAGGFIVQVPPEVVIEVIQALILVCTWPFPSTGNTKDQTYIFCGVLINLALQSGLHIPVRAQDFEKNRIQLSQTEIERRTELWASVLCVCQSTTCAQGYPPIVSYDSLLAPPRSRLTEIKNQRLVFRLRLQTIVTKAHISMVENRCFSACSSVDNTRFSLLRIFESQLEDLYVNIPSPDKDQSDLNILYVERARLYIYSFYWFTHDHTLLLPKIPMLYKSAVSVIDAAADSPFLAHGPAVTGNLVRMILLAAATILKIVKLSQYAQFVDIDDAKKAYDKAVHMVTHSGIKYGDAALRSSKILMTIWDCNKIFKKPDGTELYSLRIRTRFAVSIVFDMVYWYREIYLGQRGAYFQGYEMEKKDEQEMVDADEGNVMGAAAALRNLGRDPMAPPEQPTADMAPSMGGNSQYDGDYPLLAGALTEWDWITLGFSDVNSMLGDVNMNF